MSKHKLYSSFVESPHLNNNTGPVTKNELQPEVSSEKSEGVDYKQIEMGQSQLSNIKNNNELNKSSKSEISDIESDDDFDIKPQLKLPYTYAEDEFILKYVLKGENIFKTASIMLWKNLEERKENPKRTYQSLKNRFLRNIKPSLFTTYRHLIKDEDTEKKILMKFPELKMKRAKVGKPNVLALIHLPNRNSLKSENNSSYEMKRVQEKSPCVRIDTIHDTVRPKLPPVHKRKVEFKNDSITVTFMEEPVSSETPKTGIYDKYLKLKKNNHLIPCSHCGRPGDEPTDQGSSKSDWVIPNSVESRTEKKVGDKITPIKSSTPSGKRRKKNYDSESSSPSLLDKVEEEKNKERTSQEEEESSNFSKYLLKLKSIDVLSDKDLDILYQETVSNIRLFVDDEDTCKQITLENNSETSFPAKPFLSVRPDMSADQISVESFFMDSDITSTESFLPNPKSVEKTSNKSKEHKEVAKKKTTASKSARRKR